MRPLFAKPYYLYNYLNPKALSLSNAYYIIHILN